MKRLVGLHPEHIAFARAAQRHLDVADAIDRIGGDEGEGNLGSDVRARLIIASANAGLVAKPPWALSIISCGTCALAMRALSSVQLLGK